MREPLMTICVLNFDESGATETPALVVNWDETDDGDIEELINSRLFLYAIGTSSEDIERHLAARDSGDEAKALWRAAQSVFTWREADNEERAAWQKAYDEACELGDDKPPIYFHDLRPSAH
jgi:hypothetical protein